MEIGSKIWGKLTKGISDKNLRNSGYNFVHQEKHNRYFRHIWPKPVVISVPLAHPIVAMVFVLRVTSAIGRISRYGFNQ